MPHLEPIDFKHLANLPLELELPKNDPGSAAVVSASSILFGYFGMPWLERYVFADHRAGPADGPSASRSNLEHSLRVILVTETLLNLQGSENFEQLLSRIQDRGMLATYSELIAVRWLKLQGATLRFRAPGRVKDLGYAADARLDDLDLCVETRGRVDESPSEHRALLSELDKIRITRLPADRPGLAILTVPSAWFDNATRFEKLKAKLSEYLKTSDRLVAVALNSTTLRADEHGAEIVLLSSLTTNPASRYFDRSLETLADPPQAAGDWVSLLDLWEPHLVPPPDRATPSIQTRVGTDISRVRRNDGLRLRPIGRPQS